MTAKTTKTRKNKGRLFQQWCVKKLRELFNTSDKNIKSTPMGTQGVDIWLSEDALQWCPFSIECKSVEKIAIYKWWDQAVRNSEEKYPALLFIKANYKEPLVVMSWDSFESLLYDPAIRRYNNE